MKPRIALVLALVMLSKLLAAAAAAGTFDQIHVEVDRQSAFQDGRQKFVVTITNTSKQMFKGTVRMIAVDAIDSRVDADVISLVNDGLAPDGAQQWAILWFKDPLRIATVKYEISGGFHDVVTAAPTDVPFDELGRQAGGNYMSVFVYTPVKDCASLEKIGKFYKERYASQNLVEVTFFSDRKKALSSLPRLQAGRAMNDAAYSCLVGTYWRNKANGSEGMPPCKKATDRK